MMRRMTDEPSIASRRAVFTTPWFSLVEKVVRAGESDQPFYSLDMADYVVVLATTPSDEVVLVRQYRPAVERVVLELPSGHVDPGETPERAAARELEEETGFRPERLELLGTLAPDVGRLSNRLWCYRANVVATGSAPEEGIDVVTVTPAKLREMIIGGTFDHALHVSVVLLAMLADPAREPGT